MLLTTKNIKSLSLSFQKNLTLKKLLNFINPIVTDPNVSNLLNNVVGKKGDKKIKISQSNEFLSNFLGFNDYNTLLAVTEKNESLQKQEIINKLEVILNTLKSDKSDYLKNYHINCFSSNINNFKEDSKDEIISLISLLNSDEYDDDNIRIESLNILNLLNCKIVNFSTDIYCESTSCEFNINLIFESGDNLNIDGKVFFDCDSGEVYFFDPDTTINNVSIEDLDCLFIEFLTNLVSGYTSQNMIFSSEIFYSEDQIKLLSAFVSSF